MDRTTKQLAAELASHRCQCGRKKQRKQTFCSVCYYAVDRDTRLRLYRKMGAGYEEAREAAQVELRALGRTPKDEE